MHEEFIKQFFEESNEQLESAEKALILYENEHSIIYIEEAFRSLHTIKGAANMFGFTEIGEFAHLIENILDEIRNGKVQDPTNITTSLIGYIDHLKIILLDPALSSNETRQGHEIISKDLKTLFNNLNQISSQVIDLADESTFATFYLHIQAKIKIEKRSNHPVINTISELSKKGKTIINPHVVDEYYDFWDIYIADNTTVDQLEMEFMFFDTEVEVKAYRLSSNNLFGIIEFEEEIISIDTFRLNEKLERLDKLIHRLNAKKLTKSETRSTKIKASSLRVSSEKIETLMNTVSELVTELAHLSLLAKKHTIQELDHLTEKMERHILQLRDTTFDMSLVPVSSIVNRLQRIVRDSSKALGKEIELEINGAEIEIDKSFLELLSDPFMHILRNAIDHGIESKAERKILNKPLVGKIKITAYRSGADVVFEFKDDGRGLDTTKILKKAIENGLVSPSDNLSQHEIFALILQPGFSTANAVTNISGRGVGMDVVKNNVQELKGSIAISSNVGLGTSITIRVPLTLSIIDGLLFRIADLHLLIPLNEISKCLSVSSNQIKMGSSLFRIDNDFFPLINLNEQFDLQNERKNDTYYILQVISGDKHICITADEILGEFQAVIKPIGEHYAFLEYLAGATILGDGSVALVLETNKLQSLTVINHAN